MRCSSTTRVLVPRRALILGYRRLPGNQQPEILLAGGTPSQVSRLASLRRVVPGRWGLTLPSALEHGGSLLVWLAFGAMVAGIFCLHWRVFTWARTIWD